MVSESFFVGGRGVMVMDVLSGGSWEECGIELKRGG